MFVGSFDTNYVRRWMVVYGGSGDDQGSCVTADNAAGRTYVGGATEVTSAPFPQSRYQGSSTYQESYSPSTTPWAGFIASFADSNGKRIWVTHMGGESATVLGMDTDDDGNLYAVGVTYEDSVQWSWGPTGDAFPLCGLTGSYLQTEINPFFVLFVTSDAFIMKFDSGGHLRWSTPWGGDLGDALYDVGVDGQLGQLWCAGATSSIDLNLTGCPTTPVPSRPLCNAGGYYQPDLNSTNVPNGQADAMLLRFDLDGLLQLSTFIGHKFAEVITKLAVPNEPPIRGTPGPGGVYVTGWTNTGVTGPNCNQNGANGFPHCASGPRHWQPYGGGGDDAFIGHFRETTHLTWMTYLGGDRRDATNFGGSGPFVDVGPDGRVYFAGSTQSGALCSDANSSKSDDLRSVCPWRRRAGQSGYRRLVRGLLFRIACERKSSGGVLALRVCCNVCSIPEQSDLGRKVGFKVCSDAKAPLRRTRNMVRNEEVAVNFDGKGSKPWPQLDQCLVKPMKFSNVFIQLGVMGI